MYYLLIIPILSAIIAQIMKMIIDALKKQFSWNDLNSYGGMPSSHSAMVASLASAVGYFEGWDSATFAICIVLALIVIRDAGGFRRQIGFQAKTINQHIAQISSEQSSEFEHLRERMGHSPLEILVGIVLGVLITTIFILYIV